MNMIMKDMRAFSVACWHTDMVILLSRGVSVVEACHTLGVSRATYYRHLKAYPDFEHQVERAKMMVSIELFRIIKEAKDWRASMWLLEKRYPRDWGPLKHRLRLHGCTCGAADRIQKPTWAELYRSWKGCQMCSGSGG